MTYATTPITPGAGEDIAVDKIAGQTFQRIKPAYGPEGSAVDVSDKSPLPVADNEGSNLLARILQLLMSPLGYDKIIGRQRGSVIVESGALTSVATVSSVTAVTTVSGLTDFNAGLYQGRQLLWGANQSAWADLVRARIT